MVENVGGVQVAWAARERGKNGGRGRGRRGWQEGEGKMEGVGGEREREKWRTWAWVAREKGKNGGKVAWAWLVRERGKMEGVGMEGGSGEREIGWKEF